MLANTSSTRAPLRHRPHQRPVVALVEEVSGLVAADDVGLQREAALAEPDRTVGRRSDDRHAVGEPERLALADGAGQPEHDALRVERLDTASSTTAARWGNQIAEYSLTTSERS